MPAAAFVLVTLLAQLAPPTADPQAKLQAQRLLDEGSTQYEKGHYAGALEKFNAAYAAYPSPKLMFNIGQANRDLGRPVESLEAFRKFLAEAIDASPESVTDARKAMAELQDELGQIRIECERVGSEVSLDGKSVGLTPLPWPIWATPGRHQVTASHASAALALENADVTAGAVQVVTLRLRDLAPLVTAAPVPKPETVPAREAIAPSPANLDLRASRAPDAGSDGGWWLGRKWTWVGAGSTVLLAAGAISVGLAMHSKFGSLDSSCGSSSKTRTGCPESDIATVDSLATTANVLWGLAGAAAVTTGVLFYVEGRPINVVPIAGETKGFLAVVRY